MAVLLTYHKLVERDEKAVKMHWKVGSMLLLILCIVFSFGMAITLHNIINVFDTRCILGAHIKMMEIPPPNPNVSTSEFDSPTIQLTEFFNESYASFIAANGASEFPSGQVEYMAEHAINFQVTDWGESSTCDYGIYIPLFLCMFSVLMVVMFAMCGRGGRADLNAFLPQPWRIVIPALVFSVIMTICAIVATSIIEGGLSEFCRSLTESLPDMSCGVAMNRFMLTPYQQVRVPPSLQRQLLTSFGIVNLTFWILSVAVLIARILFAVDFQLIRVTVKTMEASKVKKKKQEKTLEEEEGEPEPTTSATKTKEVKFDAGNDYVDSVSEC